MIQYNVFMINLFNVNMIFRITGMVFLFIIHIRFPKGKSIADIIRNRYGEAYITKCKGLKSTVSNCGNIT